MPSTITWLTWYQVNIHGEQSLAAKLVWMLQLHPPPETPQETKVAKERIADKSASWRDGVRSACCYNIQQHPGQIAGTRNQGWYSRGRIKLFSINSGERTATFRLTRLVTGYQSTTIKMEFRLFLELWRQELGGASHGVLQTKSCSHRM